MCKGLELVEIGNMLINVNKVIYIMIGFDDNFREKVYHVYVEGKGIPVSLREEEYVSFKVQVERINKNYGAFQNRSNGCDRQNDW